MLDNAGRANTVRTWLIWNGLLLSINHIPIGSPLKCYGECWESTNGLNMYINRLLPGAPQCKPSDRSVSVDCNEGCSKLLFKVTAPEAMEFTLYDCDQSESPVGCAEYPDNRGNYNATQVNYKCKSDFCNTPGEKSCGPGASEGKGSSASGVRPNEKLWDAASVMWTILASSWLSS